MYWTWVSGYSQPLGIALGNVCPNFRSFDWTWDFFSMVGWKINNNSPTIWDFLMCVFCVYFLLGLWCDFLLLGPNFFATFMSLPNAPLLNSSHSDTKDLCPCVAQGLAKMACENVRQTCRSNQREIFWISGKPWFFSYKNRRRPLNNLEQLGTACTLYPLDFKEMKVA